MNILPENKSNRKKPILLHKNQLLIILIVAVTGLLSVLIVKGMSNSVVIEPESGMVSGNATISNLNDSNGKYIQFGTTKDGQCIKGGAYLWSHLESCGWPGPSNTGPVLSQCPGGVLTNNTGNLSRTITISTDNTNLSCQNITGCIRITGSNIIMNNIKITCNTGLKGTAANGKGSIYIENGASATITNTEINGDKGVHACIWHQGKSITVDALNCYQADDGIFSWADINYSQTTGDNFIIRNSYFHDFTKTTSNGHIDGYQTEGAGNGLIDHNTFYMTSDDNNYTDSAIAIWNSLRSSHDIVVQNNLLSGGGATVYAEDYSPSESNNAGGFTTTKISFKNNQFSTIFNQCVGFGPGWDGSIWFRVGPTDGWSRTGNKVIETNENVDNNNPHTVNGALCN